MKMIVGLGNPGQKYVGTRHNIGFEVLGEIARKQMASIPRAKFEGEYSEVKIGDSRVVLLCPLTYMNLSGRSVQQAASFFKVQPADILVVCDDFNLSVERIRFRPSGSAGGQNGLADIIKCLGTQDYPRLRVGIGPVPDRWNPADFVLGKFTKDEIERLKPVVDRCAKGIQDWVQHGIRYCMNHHNGMPDGKKGSSGKKSSDSTPDDSSGQTSAAND